MNNLELDSIPILHTKTHWEKISVNHYLLYNEEYQTKMFVSYSAIAIICQINGKRSIREITDNLINEIAIDKDYERVSFFIQEQLYKNGILETNDSSIKRKHSHIHSERIIITENVLRKICSQFLFLFNKQVAIFTLSMSIAIIVWLIIKKEITFNMSIANINIFIFIIGLILIFLIHELGHCVALQYYGENSKGIGVGFYFFSN
ncbi:MAG: hypothetical protein LBE13_11070, partial [Bacteroidales bacterium]|nr:hypothetical protein [Bacteroidales bacterium]